MSFGRLITQCQDKSDIGQEMQNSVIQSIQDIDVNNYVTCRIIEDLIDQAFFNVQYSKLDIYESRIAESPNQKSVFVDADHETVKQILNELVIKCCEITTSICSVSHSDRADHDNDSYDMQSTPATRENDSKEIQNNETIPNSKTEMEQHFCIIEDTKFTLQNVDIIPTLQQQITFENKEENFFQETDIKTHNVSEPELGSEVSVIPLQEHLEDCILPTSVLLQEHLSQSFNSNCAILSTKEQQKKDQILDPFSNSLDVISKSLKVNDVDMDSKNMIGIGFQNKEKFTGIDEQQKGDKGLHEVLPMNIDDKSEINEGYVEQRDDQKQGCQNDVNIISSSQEIFSPTCEGMNLSAYSKEINVNLVSEMGSIHQYHNPNDNTIAVANKISDDNMIHPMVKDTTILSVVKHEEDQKTEKLYPVLLEIGKSTCRSTEQPAEEQQESGNDNSTNCCNKECHIDLSVTDTILPEEVSKKLVKQSLSVLEQEKGDQELEEDLSMDINESSDMNQESDDQRGCDRECSKNVVCDFSLSPFITNKSSFSRMTESVNSICEVVSTVPLSSENKSEQDDCSLEEKCQTLEINYVKDIPNMIETSDKIRSNYNDVSVSKHSATCGSLITVSGNEVRKNLGQLQPEKEENVIKSFSQQANNETETNVELFSGSHGTEKKCLVTTGIMLNPMDNEQNLIKTHFLPKENSENKELRKNIVADSLNTEEASNSDENFSIDRISLIEFESNNKERNLHIKKLSLNALESSLNKENCCVEEKQEDSCIQQLDQCCTDLSADNEVLNAKASQNMAKDALTLSMGDQHEGIKELNSISMEDCCGVISERSLLDNKQIQPSTAEKIKKITLQEDNISNESVITFDKEQQMKIENMKICCSNANNIDKTDAHYQRVCNMCVSVKEQDIEESQSLHDTVFASKENQLADTNLETPINLKFVSALEYHSSQSSQSESGTCSQEHSQSLAGKRKLVDEEEIVQDMENGTPIKLQYMEESINDIEMKSNANPIESDILGELNDQLVPTNEELVEPSDNSADLKLYPSGYQAYKWKYAPSVGLDITDDVPKETSGEDKLLHIHPIPVCKRNFRLGLSKRQSIQPLHKKFKA